MNTNETFSDDKFPTPEVLKGIRKSRNFSLTHAANEASLDPSYLKKIESGSSRPKAKTIKKLADAYVVPEFVFYRKTVPELPQMLPDFRTERNDPVRLSSAGLKVVLESQTLSQLLNQEEIRSLSSRRYLPNASVSIPAKALASEIQALIGLSKDHRENAKDARSFLRSFRARVEKHGIFVFSRSMEQKDCKGFCLTDQSLFIILNRTRHRIESRTFTLAHELCHILLKQPGVSDPYIRRNSTERYCNSFAANLLAPEHDFVSTARWISPTRDFDNEAVARIAQAFHISQQAVAIRLEEVGLVDDNFHRRWLSQWNSATPPDEIPDERGGGPNTDPAATKLSEYGFLFSKIAHEAVARGYIDEIEIYRHSGLKPKYLNRVAAVAENQMNEVLPDG